MCGEKCVSWTNTIDLELVKEIKTRTGDEKIRYGPDNMSRACPVSRAASVSFAEISARLLKARKINFVITWQFSVATPKQAG